MNQVEENILRINEAVTYTKTITRASGEMVKLVARYCPSPFSLSDEDQMIDVYRQDGDRWILCADAPSNESWKSVEHYVNNQRAEKLAVGSVGAILKTLCESKKLLAGSIEKFNKIGDSLFEFEGVKFKLEQ